MHRSALVGSAVMLWLHSSADAASFDCAQATTPRELTICANQPLSDADEKMGALYNTALAKLSPQGSRLLRDGQRSWLRFLGEVCPIGNRETSRDKAAECLLKYYSERLRDLEHVATQNGPFVFNRVDHYSLSHLKAAPSGISDIVTHHSATPRIDQPLTPLTALWNEIAARPDNSSEPDCGAGDGNTWLGYEIGFASHRIISVTWVTSFYCPGTPHGYDTAETQTLVLSPTPHPLQPTDLFRPDSPWQERLSELMLAGVRDAAAKEQIALDARAEGTVSDLTTDPRNWTFTKEGLEIHFAPYVLGAGRFFHPDVTAPWPTLNGILVADPPVP